jgi:hypothetical protein
MRFTTIFNSCLGCFALLSFGSAQNLPYNPARVFLSSADHDALAYIFQPSSSSSGFELYSLDITSKVSASNLSLTTLSTTLPFAADSAAYVPVINGQSEISVYAGNCSSPAESALWQFTPSGGSSVGNGTWSQTNTSTASDAAKSNVPGAAFLATGFSFSSTVGADTGKCDIYIFGGMCPNSSAEATSTTEWQAAATYSNDMLKLIPTDSAYTLDLSSSRGPPIAEAGFSITGLQATYSNLSSGVVTQQQNFVLLGGHTQTAFINMSQVALFSLPEETWSFVTIENPSSESSSELTKRVTTTVDSRSGHTAVLTEDGTKILVFGGWVGDIDTPADPQFVVLEIGAGYGGSGSWAWGIPSTTGSGLDSGAGIYGHGAVMLPGNIMMVVGGYTIPSSSSKVKRSTNSQTYFFNATSMAWADSYTNPSYSSSSSGSKSSSSSSKKVGLGTGLGLGFAAIVGAVVLYFWYRHSIRKERKAIRDRELLELSLGAARPYHGDDEGYAHRPSMSEHQSRSWSSPLDSMSTAYTGHGYENIPGNVSYGSGGIETERSASMPNSNEAPKRNMYTRNARGYMAAPSFETRARSNSLGTAGPIHPIYELEEEDMAYSLTRGEEDPVRNSVSSLPSSNVIKRKPVNSNNRASDPFIDPPQLSFPNSTERASSTPSPEATASLTAEEREREIQEWISDWTAAEALMSGRTSPKKSYNLAPGSDDSARTNSNLSEGSAASASAATMLGRSMSQRSNSIGAFFAGKGIFSSSVGSSAAVSPTHECKHAYHDSGSSTLTGQSFGFPALITEGEGLLPRPGEEPGSPSKLRRGKGGGWLVGSLKKVWSGEGYPVGRDQRSPSFSSREGSPSRPLLIVGPNGEMGPPRRTASAGATLWRRKQGKTDWKDSEREGGQSEMERAAEEEWDIERAVENRVVQVMFTVPKERLRVVNADSEDEDDTDEVEEKKQVGMKEPIVSEEAVDPETVSNAGEDVPREAIETEEKEEEPGFITITPIRGNSKSNKAKGKEPARSTTDSLKVDTSESASRNSSLRSYKSEGISKGRVAEMVEKMEGLSPRASPVMR